MISEPVSKLLVAQVSHELGAHQLYLGIAALLRASEPQRMGQSLS